MKAVVYFASVLVTLFSVMDSSNAWSGHYDSVSLSRASRYRYCALWFWWWGCSDWRSAYLTHYYTGYRCTTGWRHDGDQNCTIPICYPECENGGICEQPNLCNCPDGTSGPTTGCNTLLE